MAEDINRICDECKEAFVVTVKEQEFLRETFGETFSIPKRCVRCRRARREQKGADAVAQANVRVPPPIESKQGKRDRSRRS